MRRIVAVTILAGACGGASQGGFTLPSAPDKALTVHQRIANEIGAEAAILFGAEGVLAVSPDGTKRVTLVEGPVGWAILDGRADVIWFVKPFGGIEYSFGFLDLQGTGTPEPVFADYKGYPISISYGGERLGPADLNFAVQYVLELHKSPVGLTMEEGNFHYTERATFAREAFARLTLADPARLEELAARGKDRSLWSPAPAERPPAPNLTIDRSRCEEPELCGNALWIPNTKLFQVVVSHSCGDGCYVDTLLFDAEDGTFVDAFDPSARAREPNEDLGGPGAAIVAPDGGAWTDGRRLVSFETGIVFETSDVDDDAPDGWQPGGGFIGGGFPIGPYAGF